MSRSQIVAQEHIVSMEPKVLQVLRILAQHQGQVVSHETILAEVWPDVVVAPNALQRCIAQLRKAFGDDAKAQKVIATHPKVGYSLLLDVDWQEAGSVEVLTEKPNSDNTKFSALPLAAMAIAALLVVVIGWLVFQPAKNELPLSRLSALTTTDTKEFFPSFSPDGRYIAFQRFLKACQSQLWVKDLTDNREYLVTEQAKVYGPPAWSADSKQLAFSVTDVCSENNPVMGCSSIHAASFALAKAKPQPTRELLACDEYDYGGVNWMGNDKLMFVAAKSGQGLVQTMSLQSGKVETFFEKPGFEPYALAYSNQFNKAAVTVFTPEKSMELVIIDGLNGQFEKTKLKVPAAYATYNVWDPSWMHNEEKLLVGSGNTVFKLDLNGTFEAFVVPTFEDIYTPVIHPDGTKIAATMGTLDFDIGEYQGLFDGPDKASLTIKHRSIVEDKTAKYRPNSNDISFLSKRDKYEQIYLEQQGQLKQLSQLNKDQVLAGYLWSADGKFIVALVNAQLQVLRLDGQSDPIETPFKGVRLYHWIDDNTVLLAGTQNNERQVIAYNIDTGQHSVLYRGFTRWAVYDEDSLYFTDNHPYIKRYWQGNVSTFEPTAEHSTRLQFFIRDGQLFLVDQIQRLWRIDISSGKAVEVKLLPIGEIYWSIDDLDLAGNRFLFSNIHAARKEIVMFE